MVLLGCWLPRVLVAVSIPTYHGIHTALAHFTWAARASLRRSKYAVSKMFVMTRTASDRNSKATGNPLFDYDRCQFTRSWRTLSEAAAEHPVGALFAWFAQSLMSFITAHVRAQLCFSSLAETRCKAVVVSGAGSKFGVYMEMLVRDASRDGPTPAAYLLCSHSDAHFCSTICCVPAAIPTLPPQEASPSSAVVTVARSFPFLTCVA